MPVRALFHKYLWFGHGPLVCRFSCRCWGRTAVTSTILSPCQPAQWQTGGLVTHRPEIRILCGWWEVHPLGMIDVCNVGCKICWNFWWMYLKYLLINQKEQREGASIKNSDKHTFQLLLHWFLWSFDMENRSIHWWGEICFKIVFWRWHTKGFWGIKTDQMTLIFNQNNCSQRCLNNFYFFVEPKLWINSIKKSLLRL